MKQTKSKITTQSMVLIGLFSALCYIALMTFKIPIPSPVDNPFIHMGNMIVILAALLFGGPIGGLSGSLGMGLFDLLNGWVSSAPKTIVLKLGIGLVTGKIASKGHKQNAKSPLLVLIISATTLIALGALLLGLNITYGPEIGIPFLEKAALENPEIKSTLLVIPVVYIFSLVLGIGMAITCLFIKKVPLKVQYAIIGAVGGIAFNLIGEFLFSFVELLILGSHLSTATVSALINLPATIINGSFSIVIAVLLYVPLSKIVARLGYTSY